MDFMLETYEQKTLTKGSLTQTPKLYNLECLCVYPFVRKTKIINHHMLQTREYL